jgi:hypothetical protein
MRRFYIAIAMLSAASAASPAVAQKSGDPNLGHFYMARQQIQIMDDTPAVNDMRTQPAPPGAAQGPPGIPGRPVGLPRAGFAQYAPPPTAAGPVGLPKVVNGVPPKAPPAVMPKTGQAGAYKTKPAAAPKPTGPITAKKYAPYNGYGGGNPYSPPVAASSGSNTSTAIRGTLMNQGPSALHWARTRNGR